MAGLKDFKKALNKVAVAWVTVDLKQIYVASRKELPLPEGWKSESTCLAGKFYSKLNGERLTKDEFLTLDLDLADIETDVNDVFADNFLV